MFKTNRTLIIILLILAASFSRLLFIGIPNFAPIAAMALLGGAFLNNKWMAMAIPIAAMVVSDLILHFFTGWGIHSTLPFVYVGMALITLIGFFLQGKVNFPNVAGAALGGSLVFFLLTNLGVWITSPMYPMNITGLFMCYAAAIPFFHYSVAGDLLFTGILFGSAYFILKKQPSLAKP